jgi:hypothetical protein
MSYGFASIRKEQFPQQRLDQQAWFRLIGEIPELRRVDTLEAIHPLTKSKMLFRVNGAEMIQGGARVGLFVWQDGEIRVDGPYSMFPVAQRIAQALGAQVVDDCGEELLEVPDDD